MSKLKRIPTHAVYIEQPIVIVWRERYDQLEAAERELMLLKAQCAKVARKHKHEKGKV